MAERSPNKPVQCPICKNEFDPEYADGWCPNFECGEFQHPAYRKGSTNADEKISRVCPDCDTPVNPDDSYCGSCGTRLKRSESSAGESSLTRLYLEVGESVVDVEPGEPIGSEIRTAWLENCGSKEEALRIHREHILIDSIERTGTYTLKHIGTESVKVDGETLEPGSRTTIQHGSRIELSDIVALTVQFR